MNYFEVICNGIRLDMFAESISEVGFWNNLLAHYDLDNCKELIVRAVSEETYNKFASDVDADASEIPSVPLY